MRASSVLLILLLFCGTAWAQESISQSRKIKIKAGVYQLDSLLKDVSKKTGATFSFDAKKINGKKRITLSSEEITLVDFLIVVEKLLEVQAIKLDSHIVFVAKPKSIKQLQPTTVITNKKTTPVNNEVVQQVKKPGSAPSSLSPSTTTLLKPDTSTSIKPDAIDLELKSINTIADSLKEISIIDSVRTATSIKKDTIINTPPPIASVTPPLKEESPSTKKKKAIDSVTYTESPEEKKIKKSTPFFAKIGVAANDIIYAGAILQAGLPYFYGTVGAGTNFNVHELRYGAGTSFKLNDAWQLNVQFDFGKTSKTFHFDSLVVPVDSSTNVMVKTVNVKSKLGRLNIFFERTLFKNLTFQIGPTINLLNTEYFVNNKKSKIGSLGSEADKKYRTLSPPYQLKNTYEPTTSSNVKLWVGVQVGLFYTIGSSGKK